MWITAGRGVAVGAALAHHRLTMASRCSFEKDWASSPVSSEWAVSGHATIHDNHTLSYCQIRTADYLTSHRVRFSILFDGSTTNDGHRSMIIVIRCSNLNMLPSCRFPTWVWVSAFWFWVTRKRQKSSSYLRLIFMVLWSSLVRKTLANASIFLRRSFLQSLAQHDQQETRRY